TPAPTPLVDTLSLHDALPIYAALGMFGPGMGEDLADLGIAAAAVDAGHQPGQSRGIHHPFGGPALAKTAKIEQLHLQGAVLGDRSEEHTSELQSRENLVCRLL